MVDNRAARLPHCFEALPASWLAIQLGIPAFALAMLPPSGARWALIPFLWLVPVLVVAAGVDIRLMLIPRRIAWVGFGVGLALIGGGDAIGWAAPACGTRSSAPVSTSGSCS